jgi:hypothetical protein
LFPQRYNNYFIPPNIILFFLNYFLHPGDHWAPDNIDWPLQMCALSATAQPLIMIGSAKQYSTSAALLPEILGHKKTSRLTTPKGL